MYKLPLFIILFILTSLFARASVVAPSILIQNYTLDDYNASCQNWGLSISYNGTLYVANNSGLLTFDGNTWRVHTLPDQSAVTGVTFLRDTVYTCGESTQGFWTWNSLGDLNYHPLDQLPSSVGFESPKTDYPIPEEIRKAQPSAFATVGNLNFTGTLTNGLFITDAAGNILLHLSLQNQLPDNIVRAICVQDESQIWVAFDNGLSQIAINPPITMLGTRSEFGKLVSGVLNNNELFIQTSLGYFKRLLDVDDKFHQIPEEEAAHYLKPDTSDHILTVNGVFTNRDALGVFSKADRIYSAPDDLYWLVYKNEAGLFHDDEGTGTLKCRILLNNYNMNVVTRGECIVPLNDSLHLVSAMQGTLLINTRELIQGSLGSTASLHFTNLEYSDIKGLHHFPLEMQELLLPHDFRELSVSVSTSVFTPNHQISYKIEGVSSDWSAWQKGGAISFLQLPEGQYELRVRKYVVKGPFPEITLSIIVSAPWYNTVWAYLIYIVLAGFILQAGLRFYLQNLRKEEEDRLEIERRAEQEHIQQLKSEMLEAELASKNNELSLQTSALVKKNQSMQTLLTELEKQKETLGDRYPNKLYTRMRSLIEETMNDQDNWFLFESYFNSAHQNFMERLRQKYADITVGDLRICCMLRMNLSTKEIASLLNISIRAVELRRYRLRKRMALDAETNLVDFLMCF